MHHQPDPDPAHIAAIAAGVERAVTQLLTSPDLDSQICEAIRQGIRDGLWHLGTAAADMPPVGHAD